jgi:hypothetical protein
VLVFYAAGTENLYCDEAEFIEQVMPKLRHCVTVQLTNVNDRMSEHTLGLNSQNATLLHMVQRHRDILQDYSHEFQKTKSNIMAVKEREELLGSAYRDSG